MMSKKYLLLIVATAVISGFSIFINSFGVKLADATQYTFVRNLFVVLIVSSLILLPAVRHQFSKISKREWCYLGLVGLIGGSIAFILFFEGLSRTTGTAGSLIHKTLFIWIAIAAPLLLKEKVKKIFIVYRIYRTFKRNKNHSRHFT